MSKNKRFIIFSSLLMMAISYFSVADSIKKTETEANLKKDFICDKETITIEHIPNIDEIILTDKSGKSHKLKSAISGSGELYTDTNGMTIHMKGNEGVYKASQNSREINCTARD